MTKQGNRLSCRDQEGRRGSDEVVLGPSVFPSMEPSVSAKFCGRIKGVKCHPSSDHVFKDIDSSTEAKQSTQVNLRNSCFAQRSVVGRSQEVRLLV